MIICVEEKLNQDTHKHVKLSKLPGVFSYTSQPWAEHCYIISSALYSFITIKYIQAERLSSLHNVQNSAIVLIMRTQNICTYLIHATIPFFLVSEIKSHIFWAELVLSRREYTYKSKNKNRSKLP